MAEAARIFVSHAHEDNAWCYTFVVALRQGGATVWYDEHNLGYGALEDEIERELRARPIFLVILSPASIGKPTVADVGAAAYAAPAP
jgi:TIR domain